MKNGWHSWVDSSMESARADASLIHARLEISEKGFKRLRVIYNETKDPVTIVTAYFD